MVPARLWEVPSLPGRGEEEAKHITFVQPVDPKSKTAGDFIMETN